MSKPVTVSDQIDLPDNQEQVTFTLEEDGAAPVRFHAALYLGKDLVRPIVVSGKDKIGRRYALDKAQALRGMRLVCAGFAFGGGKTDTIKLNCRFEGKAINEKSDPAVLNLTTTVFYREFYFFCDFQ